MSINKSYVAFFDLDKTILSVNSGKILVLAAYKKGLLSNTNFAKAIVLSLVYKLHLINNIKITELMAKWLKGVKKTELENLSNTIIRKTLLKNIRLIIKKEIDLHKNNNAQLIILSASMPNICIPIAKYLEFDDIICSKMEIVNNLYTGKSKGKICMGEQKAFLLKEYCINNSFNLNKAFYYGDSISDKEALEIVGNPICIFPQRKLLRIAEKNNWKIIN